MVFDIYNQFREDPQYNKLVGNDYMIMEYKCPIDTIKFHLMTEMNFIYYVISGKKDWITPQKTYQLKDGDSLFLRKGAYTTRQYFEVDHCVLLFFISDDFIRRFIIENEPPYKPDPEEYISEQVFEIQVNDAMKSLFFSMYNYLNLGTSGIPRNLVELKFKELLFNIILNPGNKKLTQFFCSLKVTNKTNLDHVMMNNFHHDLQLDDFARLCGRSLSAFKRDFKNFYQQSPGKWLIDKRLGYARSLILNSDMNINEICYESGFRNPSHFNKAFKEKYQLPPQQFRISKVSA